MKAMIISVKLFNSEVNRNPENYMVCQEPISIMYKTPFFYELLKSEYSWMRYLINCDTRAADSNLLQH